jgi:cysteine-rich repeat protein
MLVLLTAWTGCNQVAGIRLGDPFPDACVTVSDCDARSPSCRTTACVDELCVYTDKPKGAPTDAQIEGDCQEERCDGEGRAELAVVPEDIEDDKNPCTADTCVGSAPAHTFLTRAACYTGPPGTLGVGWCVSGTVACQDGKAAGPCVSERVPDLETCLSIFDEDCDGQVNEEGLGCVCVPGTTGVCYGGPESALGTSSCKAGTQLCNDDGLAYGDCIGDVLPGSETCDASMSDEDCDGKINEEGEDCVCGDGLTSNDEACDDGNAVDADGCTNACLVSGCGNNITEAGEDCDDGNDFDGDGCTKQCKAATCGDGIVQVGVEACDDGDADEKDACTPQCEKATCGDGIVWEGVESCDDDNTDEMDGCTSVCAEPRCGDGVVSGAPEICDDGNGSEDDECNTSCKPATVELALGRNHSCVRFANGSVKCWGYSSNGETGSETGLAVGDEPDEMGTKLPTVNLGSGKKAISIASGWDHTCVILDDKKVKCWGANDVGQLGLGDTMNRGDAPGQMGDALPYVDLGVGRTAKAITAGGDDTCAILDNDTLKCWGGNSLGQLGLGDDVNRGDGPGEMGDSLPTVNLGAGKTAKTITSGKQFHCVTLNDGAVKCWGRNEAGQLGLEDTTVRGKTPMTMGDYLPALNLGAGQGVLSLATHGEEGMCAILSGGLKCWGENLTGQLGLGDMEGRGDAPGTMGDALPFVNLGTGKTATSVATGLHSCAILNDGTVKCWGRNPIGQLGLGDTQDRGDMPGEMGDALPAVDLGKGNFVQKLARGFNHVCVLVTGNAVKCWGMNASGQLGLGNMTNRGINKSDMGDALPVVSLW